MKKTKKQNMVPPTMKAAVGKSAGVSNYIHRPTGNYSKYPTGNKGPKGEEIYDVMERMDVVSKDNPNMHAAVLAERTVSLPEFKKRKLNIENIPVGRSFLGGLKRSK
jgi:hypothetical protein